MASSSSKLRNAINVRVLQRSCDPQLLFWRCRCDLVDDTFGLAMVRWRLAPRKPSRDTTTRHGPRSAAEVVHLNSCELKIIGRCQDVDANGRDNRRAILPASTARMRRSTAQNAREAEVALSRWAKSVVSFCLARA